MTTTRIWGITTAILSWFELFPPCIERRFFKEHTHISTIYTLDIFTNELHQYMHACVNTYTHTAIYVLCIQRAHATNIESTHPTLRLPLCTVHDMYIPPTLTCTHAANAAFLYNVFVYNTTTNLELWAATHTHTHIHTKWRHIPLSHCKHVTEITWIT